MKLPILFKVTSTGKIQEWQIEVEDDKYRTISGQQDGKKVTSKWTIAKGKNIGKSNETTPVQQSTKAATAKWQKKRDGEYTEDLETVGQFGWRKMMLAKKYADHHQKIDWKEGVALQPKLDGIRNNQKGASQSRKGKPFGGVPHITERLSSTYFADKELDGEFYNHSLRDDFEEIVHLVRKQKPDEERLAESAEKVEYWVYDYPELEELGFEDRWLNLCQRGPFPEGIILCPTVFVHSQEELEAAHKGFLDEGYEGTIIRRLGIPYKRGRSDSLLKLKPLMDDEFEIVGAVEGKGNRASTLGKFICLNKEGKEFGCGISKDGGITMAEMTTMWENRQSYIGKMATIEFQNYTKAGLPRFGIFKAVRDYE